MSREIYCPVYSYFFFFNDTATTEIYTLSLHDALPILKQLVIKPQGISYNIQSIEYSTDTSSFVTLEVNDLYTTSNIGSVGHVKSNVIFRLPMIYSEDKWQVDIDKPLRPKHRSDL